VLLGAVVHNTYAHLATVCYGKFGDAGAVKFGNQALLRVKAYIGISLGFLLFAFAQKSLTSLYSLAGEKK
jgi:hypothetical protein